MTLVTWDKKCKCGNEYTTANQWSERCPECEKLRTIRRGWKPLTEKTLEDMWEKCEVFSRDGAMQYPSFWSNALAGEVGEFANQVKKYDNPDKDVDWEKLCEEFADVFIYWVLIAKVFGWHWSDAVRVIEKKLKEIDKNVIRKTDRNENPVQ